MKTVYTERAVRLVKHEIHYNPLIFVEMLRCFNTVSDRSGLNLLYSNSSSAAQKHILSIITVIQGGSNPCR